MEVLEVFFSRALHQRSKLFPVLLTCKAIATLEGLLFLFMFPR
jgi:hypothetical protein